MNTQRAIRAAVAKGHHPFGPSSLAQRIACPGSMVLELQYPKERGDTTHADEGTFAHDNLAGCLLDGSDSDSLIGKTSKCGRFTWDEHDADYGQVYLDTVRDLMTDTSELLVEQRYDLTHLVPGCFGTADAVILDFENSEIIVIDLKWGRGVRVDADKNPQLLAYAAGAIEQFAMIHDFKTVRGVIVQPRV